MNAKATAPKTTRPCSSRTRAAPASPELTHTSSRGGDASGMTPARQHRWRVGVNFGAVSISVPCRFRRVPPRRRGRARPVVGQRRSVLRYCRGRRAAGRAALAPDDQVEDASDDDVVVAGLVHRVDRAVDVGQRPLEHR